MTSKLFFNVINDCKIVFFLKKKKELLLKSNDRLAAMGPWDKFSTTLNCSIATTSVFPNYFAGPVSLFPTPKS